jgi:oligopeptidase B
MESPPRAPRRPHVLTAHGDERIDDWYWLNDRTDPEVIAYLEAENAYTRQVLAPLEPVRDQLYAEMRARIQETDTSAPNRKGAWWYYSRTVEGLQYAVHCRRADPNGELTVAEVLAAIAADAPGEDILLDENVAAGDSEYFALGVFDISPDHTTLAYATDLSGAETYALHFRDLTTGADLTDEISGVYYSSAWSTDNRHFFYTKPDDAMRPWQIWRHRVGETGADRLVYQDDDERFFVSVGLTRSERFVLVGAESKMTSEVHFLDASQPDEPLRVIEPRRQGIEYSAEHATHPERGDIWLILTNDDGADNFAVVEAPVHSPEKANWRPLVPHRPEVRLDSV